MGVGQLPDIGMRERQEVREEEHRGWDWTEMEGKKEEGANERRREKRLIKVQEKIGWVGEKNTGPAAQKLDGVGDEDEEGEEI